MSSQKNLLIAIMHYISSQGHDLSPSINKPLSIKITAKNTHPWPFKGCYRSKTQVIIYYSHNTTPIMGENSRNYHVKGENVARLSCHFFFLIWRSSQPLIPHLPTEPGDIFYTPQDQILFTSKAWCGDFNLILIAVR